jgi:hypothetical protein
VTDRYIYYFTARDSVTGETRLSSRPATLKAIVGQGEPVMESQLVVDHTELDDDGFFIAGIRGDSPVDDEINAQIKSVELRADSRDSEAQKMNDAAEGKDKYMLTLESRELRGQARQLKSQRTHLLADERSSHDETSDRLRFAWSPTPE